MLDDFDRMIGLGAVKGEVNKLLAGIEVERKRRERGLPMPTVTAFLTRRCPAFGRASAVLRMLGEQRADQPTSGFSPGWLSTTCHRSISPSRPHTCPTRLAIR